MTSKYKDVGKKQIIGVIEKLIQKMEIMEITLNLFIQHMDKDKTFDDFMKKKLGEMHDTQRDVQSDRQKDPSNNKEDA